MQTNPFIAIWFIDQEEGKKGHFSTWYFIQRYDVLQMYYSEARFIDKNNEVDIIIPTCCSQAEKVMDLLPPKDRTAIINTMLFHKYWYNGDW